MATKTKTPAATTPVVPEYCWQQVQDAIDGGSERILLYGPPGTGKTYAGLHMGVQEGHMAYRLQCTEDMTRAEIEGHMIPVGAEWMYNIGPAVEALGDSERAGTRFVVDEIDRVVGDPESMLMGLVDSNESIRWRHPITKQWYTPRGGYSVFATTNVENMRDLPQALKDRFPVAIRIDRPHPAALERLSPDLRQAAEFSADAKGDRRFSIRTFMEFDKLRNSEVLHLRYGSELAQLQAARLTFGKQYQYIIEALTVEAL